MKVHFLVVYVLLAGAACIFCGCNGQVSRVSLSKLSPNKKYLAEIVELWVPEQDRRFEVRVTRHNGNAAEITSIYQSPDEGRAAERLLWSDDSRYLLLVGKYLAVGRECVADNGEVIYLLYDLDRRETRCNSCQLTNRMKTFDFNDLTKINFGEDFRPLNK
jgi:hypothetical protein